MPVESHHTSNLLVCIQYIVTPLVHFTFHFYTVWKPMLLAFNVYFLLLHAINSCFQFLIFTLVNYSIFNVDVTESVQFYFVIFIQILMIGDLCKHLCASSFFIALISLHCYNFFKFQALLSPPLAFAFKLNNIWIARIEIYG